MLDTTTMFNISSYYFTEVINQPQHFEASTGHIFIATDHIPSALFCTVKKGELMMIVSYETNIYLMSDRVITTNECSWAITNENKEYDSAKQYLQSIMDIVPTLPDEAIQLIERRFVVRFFDLQISEEPTEYHLTFRQKLTFLLLLIFHPKYTYGNSHIRTAGLLSGEDNWPRLDGTKPRYFPSCLIPLVSVLYVEPNDKHDITLNLTRTIHPRSDILEWTLMQRYRPVFYLSPILDISTLQLCGTHNIRNASIEHLDFDGVLLYVTCAVLKNRDVSIHWSKYVKPMIQMLYNPSLTAESLSLYFNDSSQINWLIGTVQMIRERKPLFDSYELEFVRPLISGYVNTDLTELEHVTIDIPVRRIMTVKTALSEAKHQHESTLGMKLENLLSSDILILCVVSDVYNYSIRNAIGGNIVLFETVINESNGNQEHWIGVTSEQLRQIRCKSILLNDVSVVVRFVTQMAIGVSSEEEIVMSLGQHMGFGTVNGMTPQRYMVFKALCDEMIAHKSGLSSFKLECQQLINWFFSSFTDDIWVVIPVADDETMKAKQNQTVDEKADELENVYAECTTTITKDDVEAQIGNFEFLCKKQDDQFTRYTREEEWKTQSQRLQNDMNGLFLKGNVPPLDPNTTYVSSVLQVIASACGVTHIRETMIQLMYVILNTPLKRVNDLVITNVARRLPIKKIVNHDHKHNVIISNTLKSIIETEQHDININVAIGQCILDVIHPILEQTHARYVQQHPPPPPEPIAPVTSAVARTTYASFFSDCVDINNATTDVLEDVSFQHTHQISSYQESDLPDVPQDLQEQLQPALCTQPYIEPVVHHFPVQQQQQQFEVNPPMATVLENPHPQIQVVHAIITPSKRSSQQMTPTSSPSKRRHISNSTEDFIIPDDYVQQHAPAVWEDFENQNHIEIDHTPHQSVYQTMQPPPPTRRSTTPNMPIAAKTKIYTRRSTKSKK